MPKPAKSQPVLYVRREGDRVEIKVLAKDYGAPYPHNPLDDPRSDLRVWFYRSSFGAADGTPHRFVQAGCVSGSAKRLRAAARLVDKTEAALARRDQLDIAEQTILALCDATGASLVATSPTRGAANSFYRDSSWEFDSVYRGTVILRDMLAALPAC